MRWYMCSRSFPHPFIITVYFFSSFRQTWFIVSVKSFARCLSPEFSCGLNNDSRHNAYTSRRHHYTRSTPFHSPLHTSWRVCTNLGNIMMSLRDDDGVVVGHAKSSSRSRVRTRWQRWRGHHHLGVAATVKMTWMSCRAMISWLSNVLVCRFYGFSESAR